MFLIKPKPKSGFTLLELMIAAAIMAGFFLGVYKIYQSVARHQEIGAWVQGTTTQLRTGLTFLRNEISQASKPKLMTQMGIQDLPQAPELIAPYEKLKCPAVANKDVTDFSSNRSLLQFFMCKPGRQGIPGEADSGWEIVQGDLKVEGGKLVYERSIVTNTNVPSGEQTKPIKQNICLTPQKVSFTLKRATGNLSVKLRNFIEIEITAFHPRYTKTTVIEAIDVPFEVDAIEGAI